MFAASRTCNSDQFECETEKQQGRYHCLPNLAVCDRYCDCGGCEDEQQNCGDVTCDDGNIFSSLLGNLIHFGKNVAETEV